MEGAATVRRRSADEWKVRHYETAFSPEIQTDERHCQIGIINIQSQRGRSGQVGVVGGMGVGGRGDGGGR